MSEALEKAEQNSKSAIRNPISTLSATHYLPSADLSQSEIRNVAALASITSLRLALSPLRFAIHHLTGDSRSLISAFRPFPFRLRTMQVSTQLLPPDLYILLCKDVNVIARYFVDLKFPGSKCLPRPRVATAFVFVNNQAARIDF